MRSILPLTVGIMALLLASVTACTNGGTRLAGDGGGDNRDSVIEEWPDPGGEDIPGEDGPRDPGLDEIAPESLDSLDAADVFEPDPEIPDAPDLPEIPPTTWIRTYSNMGSTSPVAIHPTLDGGYVFASYGYTDEGEYISAVIKLDGEGSMLWGKMLRDGQPMVRDIVETPEGGFLVLFAFEEPVYGEEYETGVVRMNGSGEILWTKAVGGALACSLGYLEKLRGGGYVLGGDISMPHERSNDFWVVSVDESFDIRWQKAFGYDELQSLYAIDEAGDGGIVAAGLTFSGWTTDRNDAWVIKLDASGNVQWQYRYAGPMFQGASSIIAAAGGGYVVGGTSTYDYSGALSLVPWVFRLREDGSLVWQKLFISAPDGEIYRIVQAWDGEFVVTGMVPVSPGRGYDAALYKIAADGTLTWFKGYSGEDYDKSHFADAAYDGGYIAVGPTNSYGSEDFTTWVLKVDGNGTVSPDCPFGLGLDYTPTIVDATSTAEATSADAVITNAEVIEIYVSVIEAVVGVETLCEGG